MCAAAPEHAKQALVNLLALRDSVEEINGRVSELYSKSANTHAISYLGRDLCLVKTKWGGYVVVPGYNVDVAVGIIRDGIHEPWTTRLVQESLSRGQTYVNVGANFGYYTSLGGVIVGSEGKVFSFEANPSVFAVLLKTIMFAGIPDRVIAFNRAAYRVSGSDIGFFFDHQFAGGGHLEFDGDDKPGIGDGFWSADSIASIIDSDGRWVAAKGIMNSFKARTLALDDVLGGICVDLLHCDVEAAEPYVIEGARSTIRNSPKLRIIFEWSGHSFLRGSDEYRETVKGMWDFLATEGFSIRRLTPYVHSDGGIELSGPLSYEGFIAGEHGDYLATRSLL
ncbi:FkbM family methyltransferase [Rhizobium sp. BK491]|uniref:FkbM family methyltransferase n=1 Tax=Rhizobium sp. BK491 TaxID=2587009 RepID=UPI001611D88F|nr:FkbM family methyltransferase [Rhizobium sp. BK491]MBB3570756.1 FkbM family methyltransferase [Rhizobium sp. BK491]